MLLYQNGEKFTFEFTIHQDWPSLLWIHSTTTEICAGHDLKKPLVIMVSSGGPNPWIWHGMFFRKFGSNWSPNPMLKQTIITIITIITMTTTNNITIIAIIAVISLLLLSSCKNEEIAGSIWSIGVPMTWILHLHQSLWKGVPQRLIH